MTTFGPKPIVVDSFLYVKIATILLGVPSVILGYYAYFTSAWTSYKGEKPHEICGPIYDLDLPKEIRIPCPSINAEIAAMVLIAVCVILSFVQTLIFIIFPLGDTEESKREIWDMYYHLLAIAMMLPGGILFLASGLNVDKFYKEAAGNLPPQYGLPPGPPPFSQLPDDYKLKSVEKVVAGSLCLANCVLYGAVSYLYVRKYPWRFYRMCKSAKPWI